MIILLDWRESGFNKPDIKFYFTIALAIIIAVNYYLNHTKDREKSLNKTLEK